MMEEGEGFIPHHIMDHSSKLETLPFISALMNPSKEEDGFLLLFLLI